MRYLFTFCHWVDTDSVPTLWPHIYLPLVSEIERTSYFVCTYLYIIWLSRFEFQVTHSNTDQTYHKIFRDKHCFPSLIFFKENAISKRFNQFWSLKNDFRILQSLVALLIILEGDEKKFKCIFDLCTLGTLLLQGLLKV